ncbi:MAG: alpha/beta fold hydrolase [Rhodanobacter sp.]
MPPSTTSTTTPLWKRLLFRRLKFLAWLVAVLVVLFGGSYLFAPQWLLQANFAREAMTAHLDKQSVQAGDTRWVYYEGGEGRTIVLLHGFTSNKEAWLETAKLLTPHFHVIIPDLPGWGESSRAAGASYNVDAQAARLNTFVQALHLSNFVLVGHSMGGAIAGVFAAEHPDAEVELALVDSFGLKSAPSEMTQEVAKGQQPFVFNDRAGFERTLVLVFAHPPKLPGRFIDVLVKRNQRDRTFIERTFNELRESSQQLSLQSRLDKLTMPVLGLWCHDDKVVDISALNSLRNGLTHASAISSSTLSDCNHMPMLEKPEETAQILTGFALSH